VRLDAMENIGRRETKGRIGCGINPMAAV